MILTPLELSLGEPFEDVAVNPVGTSASSAKKAWDDATASLTRDPAVALAPLRFLAANRFGIPDPWPVESPRVLLEALAVANATAASSPSLASDLWSLAAVLLGTWARWRSERHPGGTSEAREILLSIARTVREHATRAHDNARRKLPNAPFVASQLGATPLLTLACVASAPLCPRETKAGALRDVARVAALAVDADFGATTTSSLLRPESSAQRLVAAFTYAVSAADDDDDDADGGIVAQLCASVFPAWRGFRGGFSATSTSSPEDAEAQQTSGLLLTRATQATAANFPGCVAESLVGFARVTLSAPEGDVGDECKSAAAYVAAGLSLATRRGPPSGRPSGRLLDSWIRAGDFTDDAIRRAVALASCATAGRAVFDPVEDAAGAWARAVSSESDPSPESDGLVGSAGAHHRSDVDAARALGRWTTATSCALALVRCHAGRSIPPDVEREALDAILVGAHRSSAIGSFLLRRLAARRADPKAASAAVAACARAPFAKRADAIVALVAERVVELTAAGNDAGVSSVCVSRTREFAVAFYESFRAFKAAAPITWQRALDASATHPVFQGPFLVALGLLRGVPLLETDDVSPAAGAIDALARLEFARVPDARYASLLRSLAQALSSDDERAVRLARVVCSELIPDTVTELDAVYMGGVAWRDDDALGSRVHLLLRLLPYAAPRVPLHEGLCVLSARALPCVERCLAHGRDAIVRAAHVAIVAVFRTHASVHDGWFPGYLERSLERFPHHTPAEPFVAAVGTVAKHCEPGSRLPCLTAAALVDRARGLDKAGDEVSVEAGSSLRRLVFGLLSLVDHAIVHEMRAHAEAAVVSAGYWARDAGESKAARMRAYDDLVRNGVLACSDYGRKNALVEWALKCKSRL